MYTIPGHKAPRVVYIFKDAEYQMEGQVRKNLLSQHTFYINVSKALYPR